MRRTVQPYTVDGLAKRLRDMEREIMDLQRVRNPPAQESSGAGGVPSLFVAASDASARSKSLADYVCDGTDDDVEIQAALDAIANVTPYAGRVLLSEGTFALSAPPTVNAWKLTVEGLGDGTVLSTSDFVGLTLLYEGCAVRNLVIEGPNRSDGASNGIQVADVDQRIENVRVSGFSIGISTSGTADRMRLLNCDLGAYTGSEATVRSLDVSGAEAFRVEGCAMAHDVRLLSATAALYLANRHATGAALTDSTGTDNCFAHNYLPGGASDFTGSASSQMGTNFSDAGAW